LTEFWTEPRMLDSIVPTVDAADFFLQGWLGWEYGGLFYSNGTLDLDVAQRLSRTYAQAVAGTTQSMSFDFDNGSFNLQYTINPSCKLPTEIYLNEAQTYPNGFTVTIEPPFLANWKHVTKNHIQIIHIDSNPIRDIMVFIEAN